LLTIVDLAGSERISKSGSEGKNAEEAKKINMSVSSLGNCINALANNTNLQHVPFRDSKLTRILTECLGGNSKTAICACISPIMKNYDETLTTLQFASRAIKIKVNAQINEKIEMKKIKEKLNDFIKIKNIDSIMQENNKLERDANDLKSSFNNIKNDLKKARSKNDPKDDRQSRNRDRDRGGNENERSRDQDGEMYRSRDRSFEYNSRNKSQGHYSSTGQNFNSNNKGADIQEYSSITKKFHYMILHLQSELAKYTVAMHSLQEENKGLKEKLAKMHY